LKIVFVPSSSSHVGKFRPLMDAMRDRGDDVRLLDVDAAHPKVLAAREQIEAAGYPFEVLPAGGYDPDAHWLWQSMQRRHIEEAFARVLEGNRPEVIVLGYDSFVSGRAFVRVARQRGITTVLIPDGLVVAPNPRFRQAAWERARDVLAWFLQRALRAGGPRGLSGVDGILVINAMGRDVLAGLGVPTTSIHVVGSPEYDALAARLGSGADLVARRALRSRLRLSEGRAVVLFAHQTLDGREAALIRTMLRGTRRCGAVLLTKLHPRGHERPETWRAWAEREGIGEDEAVFVHSECTSIEALGIAAACVTAYSTVSLEAFICRCPLVLVQYANVPFALPYGSLYDAALDVENPEQLECAIVAAVRDDEVRRRLEAGSRRAIAGELGGLDGRSVERSMAAIAAMMARQAHSSGGEAGLAVDPTREDRIG
jgi:hypothetical protein